MTNLLRSDFYRLFKSKSFYICMSVAMFLVGFNIFMQDWASKVLSENGQEMVLQFNDGISYGMSAFANGNVQMIIAIVLAIFVTAEFAHGTMKNVISKGFSKLQIYFSKLITMIAACYLIIISCLIVGMITATIVTGNLGDFTTELIKNIAIELLMNAALSAILVMVAMVVRNLGGVIAINILGIMTFGPLIFTVLEYLVKSKILFTDYSLIFNINLYVINETVKGSDYLRSAIVSLVYLVATSALGIYMFKKTDVK